MTLLEKTQTASRRLKPWLASLALSASFVAGGLVLPVLSASAQDAMPAMQGMGEMHGMHGMGPHNMAAVHKAAMAHLDKMLASVDATPEQTAQIKAILAKAMGPMSTLHRQMGETHSAMHAIFAAPTIDRDALEAHRRAQMAKIDEASKAVVQDFADAAAVLRPDQRAKLAALMSDHHGASSGD